MTEPRPVRVRVTHPRTDAVRIAPHRPAITELDEQTDLGEVYLTSLIRSQRRLALRVCAAVAVLLVGLALLGAWAGWFTRTPVLGVPLVWLALGLLVYPVLIGLAWWAVRGAERNEADFYELVRRR